MISESAATQFLLTIFESQGLWAMTNPRVTFESCFFDFFLVNRGCGACKSTCHLWKVFQWRFPSRHRFCFRWLFLSQQGLRGLPNHASPSKVVSLTFSESKGAGGSSESTRHLLKVFQWWFLRRQQPSFCYFWIKKGFVLLRIQASPMEGVPLMISESAPTPFSLTFSKSKGAASASESTSHLCKVFRWWFLSLQRLSFRWLFLSHRGCGQWRIHASPLEVVSLTFS